MLKEFANYIADQASLVIGTSLYEGYWPTDSTDASSLVRETGGAEKPWSSTRDTRSFQVLSRGTTYFGARDQAHVIYDSLKVWGRIVLDVVDAGGTFTIESMSALAPPQYVGQDDNGRFIFSFNYLIHMNET